MQPISLVVALAAVASTGSSKKSAPAKVQPPPLAVKVERSVAADGTIGAGGWIVVRGGRIEAVAAAAPPAGAQTLEFEHGVACPGFVDAITALGASGDVDEPSRAFTPEVQAGDAFKPEHTDFLDAARSGVTTVGLSPGSRNIVGGRVSIVRTRGEQDVAVLGGRGPMRLTLSAAAFETERAPTSRQGALPQLREMLKSDAFAGSGPFVVDAESADEVRVAVDTFGGAGKTVALYRPARADDAIDVVKGHAAFALLGPYDLDTAERDARLPKLLSESGVAVAFSANGKGAAMRLSAAIAVRHGMKPAAALQGLTSVPAKVLGVDADSGTLEAGKRADLVVFSGDPLDLSSRVELVLAGGAVVEPKKKESP
jgi:imidazolonepropionase-like amidohydrolase